MIYWFKRHLGDKSPVAVCNQFDQIFAKLGSPKEMMMIRTPGTQNVTIFMGLPTPDIVNAFAGFEPARFEDLPADFACEIGSDAELRELRDAVKPKVRRAAQGSFVAPIESEWLAFPVRRQR
jgi:hypothetical protein